MPEIRITVADKIAAAQGSPVIVCGNADYIIRCTFDSEWDAYPEKRMRVCFRTRKGKDVFYDLGMTDDTEALPILRDIEEAEIGFHAGSIQTTAPARIPCIPCITDLPGESSPPQEDAFNMLTERLNRILHAQPVQEDSILCDADGYIILDSTGSMIVVKE
ncbi:MAG: hypothetical protein IJ060_08535 [Oscillospiraceae bacterium]|nr:hypothetical protein [Oscillospiraceae bacterium]